MLRALADKMLFNQPDIESIETNFDEDFSTYKIVEVRKRKFLATFTEELRKRFF
jgi:hypothetical protein